VAKWFEPYENFRPTENSSTSGGARCSAIIDEAQALEV